jgi:hypothetical protein
MMFSKPKVFPVVGLIGLLVIAVTVGAFASVAFAQEAEQTTGPTALTKSLSATEDIRVLFEEMTLVQVIWEETGYAKTECAGNGLNNIQPSPDGPMILIPNAGDLSAGGSNVSIKLSPDGEITFVPRVQGQMIRVPMTIGDKLEGQEVLSLTMDEATQLMAAGKLVWTAKDQGPFANGHGLPGHIAVCDPTYDETTWSNFVESESPQSQ